MCAAGEALRQSLNPQLPLIGMGHLFAAGGQTLDGDGVRELYVGSLAQVGSDCFPPCLDYVALGHLHVPQVVGGQARIRYSGSPLPMGFGEAGQRKRLYRIDFAGRTPAMTEIEIPCFQRLQQLRGDQTALAEALARLAAEDESIWLEIHYEGDAIAGDLRTWLEEQVADTRLEILRVRNNRVIERALSRSAEEESLDDLTPAQVFARALEAHQVPAAQQEELSRLFNSLVTELAEHDQRAE